METFDGSRPIALLPLFKDINITFNTQKISEVTAFRVLAHFVERDAERLYTLYLMTNVRVGALCSSISSPRLINTLIKQNLTEDVLSDAHNAVNTVHQLPHESEAVDADKLESVAYNCTALFTEHALVNFFYSRSLAYDPRCSCRGSPVASHREAFRFQRHSPYRDCRRQ